MTHPTLRRLALWATAVCLAGLSLAGGASAASTAPSAQSQLAVLRHAPTSAVPAAVTQFIKDQASGGYVVDASQTRRVAGPDGGSWDVTPGDDGVCIFDENQQVGGCAATADVLAGRLSVKLVKSKPGMTGVPSDTPQVRIGLLPDDAVSATAVSRLGDSVASKPTADGLYALPSNGEVGAVTMRRAGRPSVRLTTPMKRWGNSLAHAAYIDGVPPGHYSLPFQFYYGVINYGNWVTLTSLETWPAGDPNNLCAIAQNSDGTYGAYWFCSTGFNTASHGYAGTAVRRGAGAAGAPSTSAYGCVRAGYNSLA